MTDAAPPQDSPATPVVLSHSALTVEPAGIQDDPAGPSVVSAPTGPTRVGKASNDPPPCWYCAVAEAIGWMMGTLTIHIMGSVSVVIAVIVITAIRTGKLNVEVKDPHTMLIVTAGEMALFVLASMLAVSVRYWGRTFHELNFSRPELKHFMIVVGGTLPLSLCVSAWSLPIQFGWKYLSEWVPVLKIFDSMNTMEMLRELSQTTSLPVMILVVAVLPAIGEELVFRGAIGRVLIANLGLWGGILLTSFLFGWIHIHPVHALAVIPLGIAIHLIYLWTRSFWMPMLLHFLNNCWASLTAQLGAGEPAHDGAYPTVFEGIEMATAVIAIIALAIVLWKSRVRYIQADGGEWASARFPMRVPPSKTIHRKSAQVNSVLWYTAVVCVIICHSMVALDVMGSLVAAN